VPFSLLVEFIVQTFIIDGPNYLWKNTDHASGDQIPDPGIIVYVGNKFVQQINIEGFFL
jgi:hypothetical protein